ncbi:MAG TPA: hypothetical protein VFJ56_07415 [Nitrospira sp.]|nr:hypothetical protein [Nitrospira sp.]
MASANAGAPVLYGSTPGETNDVDGFAVNALTCRASATPSEAHDHPVILGNHVLDANVQIWHQISLGL